MKNPENKEPEKNGLVKTDSRAHNYDYASLSDIVKQGYKIPKMRVVRIEGEDYIEYFDDKEWQLGAKVVVPEMRASNEAQRYGSALTYARRFTAQMALSLASDSDKDVEDAGPSNAKSPKTVDFGEVRKQIKNCASSDEVRKIYASIPPKLQQYFVEDCKKKTAELDAV